MYRGVAIGIVLAIVFVVSFELLLGSPIVSSSPNVEEMKKRAAGAPELVQLVRTNPEEALEQIDIQNFAGFIAFLDLDMAITDSSLRPYENIFDQVAAYYANDTPVEIVEAVFRIYDTKEYYYTLTYRESLEYLQDTVPPNFDPKDASGGSTKRVRTASNEIHDYLVAAYFKPQHDAFEAEQAEQEALQARIQSNISQIRQRGASEAAIRDRSQRAQNQYMDRQLSWQYNDYNRRYHGRSTNYRRSRVYR